MLFAVHSLARFIVQGVHMHVWWWMVVEEAAVVIIGAGVEWWWMVGGAGTTVRFAAVWFSASSLMQNGPLCILSSRASDSLSMS